MLLLRPPCEVPVSDCDAVVVQAPEGYFSLASVRTCHPEVPVVVLANATEAVVAALIADGADDVLPADADVAAITRAVAVACARRARQRSVAAATPPPRVPPGQDSPSSGEDVTEVVQPEAEPPVHPPATEEPAPAPAPPAAAATATGGRLDRSVVHDLNNLVLIASGHAEALRAALGRDDPARTDAEIIADAVNRLGAVVRQIGTAGRAPAPAPSSPSGSGDISELVLQAIPDVSVAAGRQVHIVTHLAHGLPSVRLDRTQLLEVLTTLAQTAGTSMPGGGTLTLSTDLFTVSEEVRRQRPWLPTGTFVRLQIADTGAGVEQQVLPQVFEPFAPGDTRSPGFPSVYGRVKQGGGYVWIDSHRGQGTNVTILLPAAQAREVTVVRPAERSRILLVEDQEEVRVLLAGTLRREGFDVRVAPDAPEGFALAPQPLDMLVTDVMLPRGSGPDVAREVRRHHPGVPVLFISGHTADLLKPADLDGRSSFLQKPFSSGAFVARVRQLLDATATPASPRPVPPAGPAPRDA